MSYFTDDNGVITNFMQQKACKSKTLRTDGQSLWSFDTRIAEHVPDGNGSAATLVYDYTYGGGAYISQTTSNHVRLTKKASPTSKLDVCFRSPTSRSRTVSGEPK